ncbi:class I SAM-dependent methyltransferase [Salimicrobium flavidum]|uniref:Methyltransferase domain-containing protein n=1 Tax=Salimicrobium flavidum TaxID=570947 RepID=A0A1N7K6U2_9BACI|nr:class I SAM-dependent methyltransferase [Salimicrobium flavidum]SIS57315.1 Methyltransferase domain-containing protein [Salimicrobium flavidum]
MIDKKWHEKAEEKWDQFSGNWGERSEKMWKEGSRKKVIPFFQSFVPEKSSVLDIGCGDGEGSEMLHNKGYDVTGVDLSSKMIEMAKQRREGIQFLQADLAALPFDEAEFDGVMVINCLEWVASPLQGIEEIKRVVKPGGVMIAGILGPVAGPRTNSYPRLEGEEVVCNTMMPWEFERLAQNHGWIVEGRSSVPKEGAPEDLANPMFEQAVSFMTLFALRKKDGSAPERE